MFRQEISQTRRGRSIGNSAFLVLEACVKRNLKRRWHIRGPNDPELFRSRRTTEGVPGRLQIFILFQPRRSCFGLRRRINYGKNSLIIFGISLIEYIKIAGLATGKVESELVAVFEDFVPR